MLTVEQEATVALATPAPARTEDAVVVEGVTKLFNAGKRRRWPWQRGGSPDGGGDRAGLIDGVAAEGGDGKAPVIAIDRVSLRIPKNEIYGVLGSNGSGKSTLIRMLSTLLIPDEGRITIFGHDVIKEEDAVKRLINRVSVEASFFKKLSPLENLYYAVRLYGMDAAATRPRMEAILGDLGIQRSRFGRPLEEMSRGMQQKVAIARAFLTSPVLLLLDEPTTGLDPRSKRDVQQFVRQLRDNHDATILLTTHDMEEAAALCERITIIDKGRMVVEATPDEMKARAATPDTPRPSLEDAFMHFTGHAAEGDGEEVG